VLVGIHDILLPDDYVPEWSQYYWSEQYLLAAWLLAGAGRMRLELAGRYVTEYTDLADVMEPLWESPNLRGVGRHAFALWMTTSR
jgi:hypothetical protein